MKFESYQEYEKAAREYFSTKDLKIPVEYMILSLEMFNMFNGNISFGPGTQNTEGCENCENCNSK